jgi:hypothetical protein
VFEGLLSKSGKWDDWKNNAKRNDIWGLSSLVEMYSPVEQRGLPLVKEIFTSEIAPAKSVAWWDHWFKPQYGWFEFNSLEWLFNRKPEDGVERIIEKVQRNLEREKEKCVVRLMGVLITEFEVRSFVLVEHVQNKLRRGPDSKLPPFLEGTVNVVQRKMEKSYHPEVIM